MWGFVKYFHLWVSQIAPFSMSKSHSGNERREQESTVIISGKTPNMPSSFSSVSFIKLHQMMHVV